MKGRWCQFCSSFRSEVYRTLWAGGTGSWSDLKIKITSEDWWNDAVGGVAHHADAFIKINPTHLFMRVGRWIILRGVWISE